MATDIDTTLGSPISFPLPKEQALAVVAAQCASEVTAAVGRQIPIIENAWYDQLSAYHERLRGEIYKFLISVKPPPK